MERILEERELAELCSEKCKWAEDKLYTTYAGRVFALCLRYSSSEDDAKDIMQDAFIKVLDNIGQFKYRGEGSLLAWISRIAVNTALNRIRVSKLSLISFDNIKEDIVQDPTPEEMAAIPYRKIMEMVSSLPPIRRAVFNMFCIEGYSHKEIGEMLGISERGSTSTLAKAKKQLKEDIRHYLNELG